MFDGHAIECRITAENPQTFVPSPGRITDYHPPGGMSVRVDSGLYAGYEIPPHYDSLVAKLVVHGSNRNECLMRLRHSLAEFVIGGIQTTIPLHAKIIENQDFINGDYDIHWLERFVAQETEKETEPALHKPMTNLTPETLLRAYAVGLFPMAEHRDDRTLYWVDPEKRGILPFNDFHIPRRLRRTVRQEKFGALQHLFYRGNPSLCGA